MRSRLELSRRFVLKIPAVALVATLGLDVGPAVATDALTDDLGDPFVTGTGEALESW